MADHGIEARGGLFIQAAREAHAQWDNNTVVWSQDGHESLVHF